VTRPRAADDFSAIRARLKELRRDRAQVWANNDIGLVEPRPHAAGDKPSPVDKPGLSPAVRRILFRSTAKAPGDWSAYRHNGNTGRCFAV
jgi:hypothetical protein